MFCIVIFIVLKQNFGLRYKVPLGDKARIDGFHREFPLAIDVTFQRAKNRTFTIPNFDNIDFKVVEWPYKIIPGSFSEMVEGLQE